MTGRIVSWVAYHGRSAGLARALGLEPVWAPAWTRRRPPLIRYAAAAVVTMRALVPSRGPVLVMLPPLPALLVVLLSRLGRRTRLVADLHSGVFMGPTWPPFLGITLRLLRGRAAIVTNAAQAAICRRSGVATFVLDDPLDADAVPVTATPSDPYVLVVLSFDPDEPVADILQAAARRPETRFVLTGSAPQTVRSSAPGNVHFSGFVPRAEFDTLLRGSTVVLGLTTQENTMQRAAYEALELGVPVVTSDTEVLRRYFRDAAVYARPTPESISEALGEALRHNEELRRRMRELRREKLRDQGRALEEIGSYLRAG